MTHPSERRTPAPCLNQTPSCFSPPQLLRVLPHRRPARRKRRGQHARRNQSGSQPPCVNRASSSIGLLVRELRYSRPSIAEVLGGGGEEVDLIGKARRPSRGCHVDLAVRDNL